MASYWIGYKVVILCHNKQVQNGAADLFPGDNVTAIGYLIKNTAGWTKFNELAIILTASLHDIIDRWADGKGPLAVQFTSQQVCIIIYINCFYTGLCVSNMS